MQSNRMLLFLCSAALGLYLPSLAVAADNGTKVFTESCTPCHSAKIRPLDNTHLTREQWKEAIDRMMDEGAEVPKKKIPELLDYLVSTHGPTSAAPDASSK